MTRWAGSTGAQRRRGLTLAELLVVVAILSVLAAITMSLVGGSKRAAKRASCTSNLKQVGVAFGLYRGDWDDRYPIDRIVREPPPPRRLVWELMRAYGRAETVFYCPEDLTPGDRKFGYNYEAYHLRPDDPIRRKLGVEAMSVAAVCLGHLTYRMMEYPGAGLISEPVCDERGRCSGKFVFLGNDGSVATVDAKATPEWKSDGDSWYLVESAPKELKAHIHKWRFPGEPWPPTFE
jgi:prepilin-type N-terminal cleavage/methylation domain-containing protein